jgi:predicted RNA-binding protein with RPS1 domain
MKYEIGQVVLGTVTNVKPYALFMEFEDGVTGLLHISEISDSFIRDIEKFGTKGDQMKVVIVSIDENNGFLRVSYKRVPKEEAFSSHNNNLRKVPETSSEDFKPLEEKLPEWIAATLKEAKENEGK